MRRLMIAVASVLTLGLGGGGCGGGMAGCQMVDQLPAPLPPDQVIEGAMQVRIAQSGFDKIEAAAPAMVAELFKDGLCVPQQQLVGSWTGDVDACDTNGCPGSATPGCLVHFALGNLAFDLPDGDTMGVDMTFDIDAPIAITYHGLWDSTCTFNFKAQGAQVIAYIRFAINAASGELEAHLDHIEHLDLSDSSMGSDDCSVLGTILGAVWDAAKLMMADWLTQLVSPLFDGLVQQFLPSPLGIEGLLDLRQAMGLLSSIPGAGATGSIQLEGLLETKVVPGGWAELKGGGLSLGVIGGLNSDADPTTRAAGHDPVNSEPVRCVPVNPSPDLTAIGLYRHPSRQTFMLDRAPALSGVPEPQGDLVIGVAQPFLDLGGFHAINSGAVCLSVGTRLIELLNVGAMGIIVPSLAQLADSSQAPMLIVLRPQRPVSFAIGTGTADDPSLKLAIPKLDADLYAFIAERYVRAFTLGLDLDAGLNLEVVPDAAGKPALQPTLVGLDSSHVKLTVANTDLITESADELEQVLPNLLLLISSALGGALQPFTLPTVGGWTLSAMQLGKLTGPSCDFLTITGSLGDVGSAPFAPGVPPPERGRRVVTTAEVAAVRNPPAEQVRAAFLGRPGGEAPAVRLRLGGAAGGAPLEWQVRVDGGLWRPFTAAPELLVTDPAFALQGRHAIEVRARRRGDWASLDPHPVALEAIIDSLPPTLAPSVGAGRLSFGGRDQVSPPSALRYGLRLGGRRTDLGAEDGLPLAQALALTDGGRTPLVVTVSDEAGNVAEVPVDVGALAATHAAPPGAHGCTAAGAGADGTAGPLAWAALAALALALGRRRRLFALTALALAASLGGGCNCGEAPNLGCTTDEDCAAVACAEGTLPLCGVNDQCYCDDDIPLGAVGRYSAIAVSGDVVLVSAYNEKYGDLMLGTALKGERVVVESWEFADGVPADGAVVLPPPARRGGIRAPGDDVGRWSAIGVANDLISVSYYDATHGALKFAQRRVDGTAWAIHTVAEGPGVEDPGPHDPAVGRFSALSLAPDGTPAVAYLAVTADADGNQTGALRFAVAARTDPQAAADWTFYTVDEAPIAAAANPPDDLPDAVGLMPAVARLPSGDPAIAYYDRPRGNLKLARFDPDLGAFAAPVILDGEEDGEDTGNLGQYPSLALEADGTAHVAYVDMGRDYGHRLMYLSTATGLPEVVDDGYRAPDPDTEPGQSPVFHFVGDSSAIMLADGLPVIAYQDSTAFELRLAQRHSDGTWSREVIAGDEDPFAGAYGFYARMIPDAGNVLLSSYVIDQKSDPARFFVEIFSRTVTIE